MAGWPQVSNSSWDSLVLISSSFAHYGRNLFLRVFQRVVYPFQLDEDFLDCEYLDLPRLVYCFVDAPAISFSFGGRVFLRSFNLPFRKSALAI